jgi:hypothetical protein
MSDNSIKIKEIQERKFISMCELQIGVCELSKDISLNNMWGFTFEGLSNLERDLENHSRTLILKNNL